jgi:hypothetical protein
MESDMHKFKVVGELEVAGVAPGGVVEFADDTDVNVDALLYAGHLEPVESKPARKADAVKESS